MRRISYAAALIGVAALIIGGASPASAATSNFTVDITADTPTSPYGFNGEGIGQCLANWSPDAYGFTALQLTVSSTGTYTIAEDWQSPPDLDIVVSVYPLSAYDPANPSVGCIGSFDASVAFPLTASESYIVRVTTWDPGATGTGRIKIDGPGTATLSPWVGSIGSDHSIWQQAYARSDQNVACAEGWNPSYMLWPNGGAGGWVCERETYAYYPNMPVN